MKKIIVVLLMMAFLPLVNAQVSIVNVSIMPYNITAESLLSATLMNQGKEQEVYLTSRLYNLNNDLLIVVRSSAFSVKSGVNQVYGSNYKVASIDYSAGNQPNYIKTSHTLPSGVFKICLEVLSVNGTEPNQYCDEIQSDFNQYLYLVYPSDKEVISTISPILSWSHSEPFSVLSTGEFFRMTVSEIKNNQSAEEAISMNSPVMLKDYVNTHNLQYPYEAKSLEQGKEYAWQVTKIGNGTILNKTETWTFKIGGRETKKALVYASLKKEVDGSFYTPENNKLFFRFQEEYNDGLISCFIYNHLNQKVEAKVDKHDGKNEALDFKQHGLNQYEIDLDKYNLNNGFYFLKVKNKKNEIFLLKFYIH